MVRSKTTKKASKKPQKISFGSKNKKALIVLVAALFVAIGVTAVLRTSAAYSGLKVCVSTASYTDVYVWNLNYKSSADEEILGKKTGECGTFNNAGDGVRVDVDAYNAGVDSYKIGKIDYGGYGPCHDHSNNSGSNPPNNAPYGVRYRNWGGANC